MNIAILAISTLIVLIVFGIPVATHPQWFKTVEEEIEEAKREGHIADWQKVKYVDFAVPKPPSQCKRL